MELVELCSSTIQMLEFYVPVPHNMNDFKIQTVKGELNQNEVIRL
jgi:hypothetical protein